MAEAFLRSFDPNLEVYSAGTVPATSVHHHAITVMSEIGIDLSGSVPKDVSRFTGDSFDYVITVCDHANETCPVFTGTVHRRMHMGFEDPAAASGNAEEILAKFRQIRDEIRARFFTFYITTVQQNNQS